MRNSRATKNKTTDCMATRANDAQIMNRHAYHMRAFYQKHGIFNDATHITLGGNEDERAKFAEKHYVHGATQFFALTGNLLASLAYGYHCVPRSLLRHIKIPERPELADEVRAMVSAYGTMREATRIYTIDEMRASFHNVTSRLDEFLMRAYDTASRLQLSREMTMLRVIENADRGIETAHKAMEFYYPYLDMLSYHEFSMLVSDAAFSVLEPERYNTISRKLYGENEQDGKKALNALADQVRGLLLDILGEFNASYGIDERFEVEARRKTIYGIDKKFKRYGLDAVESIDGLPLMNDVLAGRIISCNNSWSLVYGLLNYIRQRKDRFMFANEKEIIGDAKNFKDYVQNPKENAYQSIHTTFNLEHLLRMQIPSGLKHLEIQLRTSGAHSIAESGAANHFGYKSAIAGTPLHDAMIETLAQIHETNPISRRIGIRVIDPNQNGNQIKQPQLRQDTFTRPRLQERIKMELMTKYPGFVPNEFIIPPQIMEGIYHAEVGSVIKVFVNTDDSNRRLWVEKIEVLPIK